MIQIALWELANSKLNPFAELLNACRVDLPLKMSPLLFLVICAPCPGAKLQKQLAIFLIAQLCILNGLFELSNEDI